MKFKSVDELLHLLKVLMDDSRKYWDDLFERARAAQAAQESDDETSV